MSEEQAAQDEEYLESLPQEEVAEALKAARKQVAQAKREQALREFAERERIR